MIKWIVIIIMLSGNTRIMYQLKDPLEYATQAQCQQTVQELMWNPAFIEQMFSSEGVLSPTCIEMHDAKPE